jgi:hypothetical protein
MICLLTTVSLLSHTTITFIILKSIHFATVVLYPAVPPRQARARDAPQHSLSADAHVTSKIFPT